ncbi:PBP1A family penicillin-binding protein [Sporolactobacillus shoreicorticis]|uniref:Transglycosylase domain-containing protein n=1 Tax=Sporolactobacillus shoreicorticis TaxID=1923877 RepID=A0ABW5S6L4_9BACL|nr:PBP1A family penicillin-binding protein [Sporolactobacillus shoreicorticis]MCO7125767.1 PBP1A family penicillin-binding protein [Sporolactobacillus shoreicorticis]
MVEYHTRMEKRRAAEQEKQKGNKKVPKNKRNKKKSDGKKHWVKRIFIILLLSFLFLILAGVIFVFAVIRDAPKLDENALHNEISSVMYDQNGKIATTVDSGLHKKYTCIDSIPLTVQDAYISTEDVRFYKHFGIDPIRILGAGVAQFTKGYKSEGASTITQQVVRNAMLTQNKTFTRKIQEMYLAIQLEKKYTKKQILEMYLNQIYLGEGPTWGVAAASERYFGKNIKNVTLEQAAMLAAMTRNPGYYDPIKHPEQAKARRDLVLDLMVQNKAITADEAAKAKAVSMKQMTKGHHNVPVSNRKYGAFLDYVRHELVDEKKVITEQEFNSGGLKIYTTLDSEIQTQTQEVLNNKKNYPNVQNNFNASVSVIDTQTGAIRALGGGRNYKYLYTNWSYDGKRNIGSTAKPIMDYGPAIEYLKWPTDYEVNDSKDIKYSWGKEINDWDGKTLGKMSMRKALYLSRNIPALQTFQEVDHALGGTKNIRTFAEKLGFTDSVLKQLGESYSIGGGSFTSNPLQMSAAYASFGNNGIYNQPYAVRKIVKPDGEVIQLDHKRHVAMHDYTAYMITDMLKDVMTKGTGINANIPGANLAGKTGTTNIPTDYANQFKISNYLRTKGALDSWFVGYNTQLTTAIWTGYNADKTKIGNKNYGSYLGPNEQRYAQRIFRAIMAQYMVGASDFKRPSSVINLSNGELAVRNSTITNHYKAESKSDHSGSSDSSSSSESSSSAPPESSSESVPPESSSESSSSSAPPAESSSSSAPTSPESPASSAAAPPASSSENSVQSSTP